MDVAVLRLIADVPGIASIPRIASPRSSHCPRNSQCPRNVELVKGFSGPLPREEIRLFRLACCKIFINLTFRFIVLIRSHAMNTSFAGRWNRLCLYVFF